MWSNGTEMIMGEDYDVNSIPPIELGNGKFQDDLDQVNSSVPMQDYGHEQYALPNEQYHHNHHDPHTQGSFDGLFFNDMMASHGY